jgi:hypothetical protein
MSAYLSIDMGRVRSLRGIIDDLPGWAGDLTKNVVGSRPALAK